MTEVNVILRKKGLILIEWTTTLGVISRSWITPDIMVEEGSKFLVSNPHAGIPYGEQFSKHLQYPDSVAQDIERELRRLGVWTWEDVATRVDLVKQAFQNALMIQAAPLIATAHQERKRILKES